MSGRALVLGVGNRHRGDDAAGLLVVEALRGLAPPGLDLCALEGAPVELSRHWEPGDAVVLVDAVQADGPAGRVHRFDALTAPLPAELFAVSTHAFGVADGIELARALGALPRRLVVYGIEGEQFAAGGAVTPAVADAVEEAARRVVSELAPERGGSSSCTSTASSGT